MAHFNTPTLEPDFINPAPLRISARLREIGTLLYRQVQKLARWYQGQILMADLNDRMLRDGGLERDAFGIQPRLTETSPFLKQSLRD